MKKLIAFLLGALLPVMAFGQISTTLENSGYYYVVVGQDTLSQHQRLDKAIAAGTEYSPNGSFEIVQDFRLGVSSYFYDETIIIEEVRDTVFVPADTMFVSQVDTVYADTLQVHNIHQPAHQTLFSEVDFSMSHDESEKIHFVIKTQGNVDSLYTEIRCGTEWVENNIFAQPAETLQYGIFWNCDSPLTYQFEAVNELGWSETITNSYPLWMTEYEAPVQDVYTNTFDGAQGYAYSKTWGDLNYAVTDGQLEIGLPNRSIARLQWNEIPEHRDIQVRVVEVVDSSHSTGVHLGMRSSVEPMAGSVETYLNSAGMGVSIFNDGVWNNPHTFPVQWEYGVPIEYTVTLIGDTLMVEANGVAHEFTSAEIGAIQSGFLMIGSTGAGVYYLNEIDVQVLD